MKIDRGQMGGVLMTSLILGVLLSVLGGVAMSLALTDIETAQHQRKETAARLLAESGVEQVIAWLTYGELPSRQLPAGFHGTESAPDVVYDASRSDDDRLLNDRTTGTFRRLLELGRIEKIYLSGSLRPDGFCTASVTAQTVTRVRRSVSLELGATRIPPLQAAIHGGRRGSTNTSPLSRIWTHWGAARVAGDFRLGTDDRLPRKWAAAAVTGAGYGDAGGSLEDRWAELWVGGSVQSDDSSYQLPSNVHPHQDPVPGIPPDPWQYQKFKDLATKFGRYYVPDSAGRLYRDGVMDVTQAQTPAQVFAENSLIKGLVFIDTLDHSPPTADNLSTIVVNAPSLDGMLFINAHVVLNPDGPGKTIAAWSPPTDAQNNLASRVATTLQDINVQGVLHTTGTLRIDRQARVFGAVVAEQGLSGAGSLEVWYDYDLARGLFKGIPAVFPLSGTWREWGS